MVFLAGLTIWFALLWGHIVYMLTAFFSSQFTKRNQVQGEIINRREGLLLMLQGKTSLGSSALGGAESRAPRAEPSLLFCPKDT